MEEQFEPYEWCYLNIYKFYPILPTLDFDDFRRGQNFEVMFPQLISEHSNNLFVTIVFFKAHIKALEKTMGINDEILLEQGILFSQYQYFCGYIDCLMDVLDDQPQTMIDYVSIEFFAEVNVDFLDLERFINLQFPYSALNINEQDQLLVWQFYMQTSYDKIGPVNFLNQSIVLRDTILSEVLLFQELSTVEYEL